MTGLTQLTDLDDFSAPVLTILYQDSDIVIIDKPANMFVHRSYLNRHDTHVVLQLLRDQIGQYVYPVHRLDRPTSGVLMFALNEDAARILCQDFENHQIQKTYFALTRGFLEGQGRIDYALKEKFDKYGDKYAIKDKPAQEAQTDYVSVNKGLVDKPLGRYPIARYSLVKLRPLSGRKHQIRRHLSHINHPIIGDVNYGDNTNNKFFKNYFEFNRLMLFAARLEFRHPLSKTPMSVCTEFDTQWKQVFVKLKWQVPDY